PLTPRAPAHRPSGGVRFPATTGPGPRIISSSPPHTHTPNLPPAMPHRRLALLAVALVASAAVAADWTRFRGPDGLGTAPDKDIPVAIGPSEILWKAPIP